MFPDGSEFLDVAVVSWDPLADLAVLGPIETETNPVSLSAREDIAVGSDVYLIGYPGEAESFPQPSLSRGLVSRVREWEGAGITYFQADATIAGGQSGGVLASDDGDVIGVSGFIFSEAGFALVASSADVGPLVDALIAGEDASGLGDRFVPASGERLHAAQENALKEQDVSLVHHWEASEYVVAGRVGEEIEVTLDGETDGGVFVIDPSGNVVVYADDTLSGQESGAAVFEIAGPHFVLVTVGESSRNVSGDFHLRSNQLLIPYEADEDGSKIAVGQRLIGNIDYPYDNDFFVLDMVAGETVEITLQSPNFDPVLTIDFPGATRSQLLWDDNSGGGLFGRSSKLTYRAPLSGLYYVVVSDVAEVPAVGGYILTVDIASPDTAFVTPEIVTAPSIDSPHGPMAVYESDQHGFSIQYPADWQEAGADPELGVVAEFVGPKGVSFSIVEDDLIAEDFGELTLGEYTAVINDLIAIATQGFELVSETQTITQQGLPTVVLDMSFLGGGFRGKRLIYVHEGRVGFGATYAAPKARYEELETAIDYSLGTFRIGVTLVNGWGSLGDIGGEFRLPGGIATNSRRYM